MNLVVLIMDESYCQARLASVLEHVIVQESEARS